jgi:hypothetical protein
MDLLLSGFNAGWLFYIEGEKIDMESKDRLVVIGINRDGYGTFPKIVAQDRSISIEAKAIYAYFKSYAGAGEIAFPSIEKILFDLCISRPRYYKHLRLLTNAGYVKISQEKSNGKFSHNLYTMPEQITNDEKRRKIKYKFKDKSPKEQNVTTESQSSFVTSEFVTSQNSTSNINNLNINSINRESKTKSENIMDKILEKVPEATEEDLQMALKKLAFAKDIKNAESWLCEVLRSEVRNRTVREMAKHVNIPKKELSKKIKTNTNKYEKFYL